MHPHYSGFKKIIHKKEDVYITGKDAQNFHQIVHRKRNRKLGIFFLLLTATAVALISYGTFFFFKVRSVSGQISTTETSLADDLKTTASLLRLGGSRERKALEGEENGRINILLLGAAGEHDAGKNLTDTVMLMSIDAKDKKISLLSLPRDLYVRIPGANTYTKLNSLYAYGLRSNQGPNLTIQSVEEITGQKIHYHLIVNYDAFKEIIDSIGGINVTVERDLLDTRFPGPNYSYETFEIKKGLQKLDGQTALKYVRERHADPEGDFGRAKRQQQVIQAVKNRMFSLQTFFNVMAVNDILNAVGKNIRTDIALGELESFLTLSREVDMQHINNVVIDAWKKDSLLKVSHVQLGAARAFILVPRVGNYSEIRQSADTIFNAEAANERARRIANENARITIVNRSGNHALESKIHDLVKNKLSISQTRLSHESNNQGTLARTTIINHSKTNTLYTLDELLKKLPATLSAEDYPADDNDLTIILGADLIDPYQYDEDSLEDFNNAQDDQSYLTF